MLTNKLNKQFIALLISLLMLGFSGCSKKKKKKTTPDKKTESTKTVKADSKSGNTLEKPKSVKSTELNNNKVQNTSSSVSNNSKSSSNKHSTVNRTDSEPKNKDLKKKSKKDLKKLSKEEAEREKIKEELSEAENLLKGSSKSGYNTAISKSLNVLKRDFKNFRAMLIMARAYIKLKNFDKLYSVLNYISKIREKMHPPTKVTPMWHLLMGKYYLYVVNQLEMRGFIIDAIRQKSLAEKQFLQALQYTDAKMLLGTLYLEKGLYTKAVKLLEEVEQKDPKKYGWKLYLNLGVAYYYLNDYVKAVTKFGYAASLNSNCHKCHYNLALIYNDWTRIPKIGRMSDKERAQKLIYHAKIYLRHLKSKRHRNKVMINRLNSWIRIAGSKL